MLKIGINAAIIQACLYLSLLQNTCSLAVLVANFHSIQIHLANLVFGRVKIHQHQAIQSKDRGSKFGCSHDGSRPYCPASLTNHTISQAELILRSLWDLPLSKTLYL
jgi:hypothetical protein